jgi:DNA repair exonuclease SbcCD nuclease subunit
MNFLVFSDLHSHKFPYSNITKSGENELLLASLNIIDQVYDYAVLNNVPRINFIGDLFHIRAKIDSELYSNMMYEKLCACFGHKHSPVLFLIPGNHDQINKTGKHNLLPFSQIRNVFVIDSFYKKDNTIICPHQYDINLLYRFLEENSDENSMIFMHQLLMNSPLLSGAIFRKNEAVDTTRFKFKVIFSGHNHRPFENRVSGIFNIGSPMHCDFGDAECQERFFIHYSNGAVKWIPTIFPHFASQDTPEAKKAVYVKKKSKKIKEVTNRIEINFNDDPKNIMQVYIESEETSLDKKLLFQEGTRILNMVTQSQ